MQPSASEAPLVATKLFVPRPRPNRVERVRLRERLDASRHTVLVSAPAGSGKSTLLADWVASSGECIAWVSLDGADDDLQRFVGYLLAALRNVEAIGWMEPLDPARAAVAAATQAFLAEMMNAVAASGRRVTLVLDDYHVVESSAVHAAMQFIVDHLPPNLRVVIATRSDPPLTLSRLRARDLLTEVRAADLRFSLDEASRFLNEAMGLSLGESEVAELERRTEGWAVGLQMAALSLKGRGGADSFVAGFTGSNRYVLDYLTDEVLARQSPEVRQFLLETSILERLSAPLCDAVTGRSDSERILHLLDVSNLFLIPLDDVRFWYRYHHLFGTLLRHQMHGDAAALHQRASDWYAANGAPDEAMRHAAAAKDVDRALAIINQHAMGRIISGDGGLILRWLSSLPPEIVDSRINLLIYQASALIVELQVAAAEERIGRAEALVDRTTPNHEQSMVACVRGVILRHQNRVAEAIDHYELAVSLVPPGTPWHSIASFELALGAMANGDLIRAEKELALTRADHQAPNMGAVIAQYVTAGSRYLRGDPDESVAMARDALGWIERWDPGNQGGRPLASMPYVMLAEVHRQRNDLSAARGYADQAIEHGKRGFRVGSFEGIKARLAIAEAESDWETAERLNSEVVRGVLSNLNLTWSRHYDWLWRRLLLRRAQRTGSRADLETVIREVERAGRARLPSFFTTEPSVFAARLLVLQGKAGEALPLAVELIAFAVERDCILTAIELLIIRSMAEAGNGDIETATTTMLEALEMASRPRFVRLFADEGTEALPIVQRALPRVKDRDFASLVLAAFDVAKPVSAEGLSEREIEVLVLIAAGASNQDAARKLFISPSTVKKHLENIYAKLGVGGRTQAVARARELGLL